VVHYYSVIYNLEGLLGKQFTFRSIVNNYNYYLFLALSIRGRFVFILDGFDEMKRTMSWGTLRYNLQQLNQLVSPNSKVCSGQVKPDTLI